MKQNYPRITCEFMMCIGIYPKMTCECITCIIYPRETCVCMYMWKFYFRNQDQKGIAKHVIVWHLLGMWIA